MGVIKTGKSKFPSMNLVGIIYFCVEVNGLFNSFTFIMKEN